MALNDPTTFKGVTSWNKDTHTNNLLFGTIDFFKWGLLQIGAYQNITRPNVSGVFGGDRFQLTLQDDLSYNVGEVWRGYREDWVWESGVNFSPPPHIASGVYVDSTFHPSASTTGAFAHHIDFPSGRVIFDTAIPTGSRVDADFSFRVISVIPADQVGIQEILYDAHRVDRSAFLNADTAGDWNQSQELTQPLPFMAVEIVNSSFRPYELGGGQYIDVDMLFYIFADNPYDRNQMADIVTYQHEKAFWLFDLGDIKVSPSYPLSLDFRGSPVDNPMIYPQIVAESGDGGFRWRQCRFNEVDLDTSDDINNWLYRAILRVSAETILSEV